jgi:hypothetical protein
MSRSRIDAPILAIERMGHDSCVTAAVCAGYFGPALANSVSDLAPACQRRPGLLLLQSTLCALAVPNSPRDAYSIEPPILVSLKLGGRVDSALGAC